MQFSRIGQIFQYIYKVDRKLRRLVLYLIIGLFLIALISPGAIGIYHLSVGGKALRYILSDMDLVSYTYACSLTPNNITVNDQVHDKEIKKVIYHLKKASQLDFLSSQAYLLLGRAYCLSGQFEESISSYQSYIDLKPGNPLGRLELGLLFAYLCEIQVADAMMASSQKPMTSGARIGACTQFQSEWLAAGIEPKEVIKLGEAAFLKGDMSSSIRWYLKAERMMGSLPAEAAFLGNIALQREGIPGYQFSGPTLHTVYDIDTRRTIFAGDLQWLRADPTINLKFGDRLIDHPSSDKSVGVMWWNGVAIVAFNIEIEGTYEITIQAQNSRPAPIQLIVEINFHQVGEILLERGDQSWEDSSILAYFSNGTQILGIRYTNDGMVDGIDRNATIRQILIGKYDEATSNN
jgi:tetratricopeptide (TPR) repeat protein